MKAKLGNELLEYPEILKCPVCAAWMELPKEVTAVIEAAKKAVQKRDDSDKAFDDWIRLVNSISALEAMKGKE